MNKASGGDGIPVELLQMLNDDAVKELHSICQQIWKTQQWPQDWKSCFHSSPKERQYWSTEELMLFTVVFEKTLESPLDCKEIQPVYPKRGQSWVFIGRTDAEAETPMLWPPDVKNFLGKDPDAGKD